MTSRLITTSSTPSSDGRSYIVSSSTISMMERRPRATVFRTTHLGAETDRRALAAHRDDLVEAREGAAADEQDVGRVDLQEFLLRVLAAALRRDARDRAFHDLE